MNMLIEYKHHIGLFVRQGYNIMSCIQSDIQLS